MDVHMHNNRTLHYSLNDGPKRFSEDDLQFLSLEEQECILFFEETIGSLEEDDERTGMFAVERPASHTQTARHHSAVDYDIIDLVHPTPHPNKQKDTLPIRPDFQELKAAPENHYEVKAKRDPPAMLHVSDAPPQEVRHQPPAGSAIIANKIAKHEGVTSTSQLIHTKPTRLPNSIGVLLGSRDNIPHSIATEAASVQERREQKLANLSGSEHPLIGGEPSCVRKLPMRSISFRDPTPDMSRMEALSKLGLDQGQSQSIMHTSQRETTTFKSTIPANASADVRSMDTTDHCQTRRSQSIMHTSPRDGESVKTTTFKSTIPANASADVRSTDSTDHCQTRRSQSIMHTSPRDAERTKTTTFKSTIPANASADVRSTDSTDHCQTRRSQSIMHTSPRDAERTKTTTFKSTIPANASADVRSTDSTDHCQTRRSQSIMHTSPRDAERTKTTTFKSTIPANASADVRSTDTTDHCQTRRSQSIMHTSQRDGESVKTTTFKSTIPANASADVRSMDTTDHCQTRRSQSIMHTSPRDAERTKTTTFKSTIPANASADVRSTDTTDHCQTRRSQSIMRTSPRDAERTKTTTFKSTFPANANADIRATDTTDHCQTKSSPAPILTSAEVTHTDFNSYGGKSITLNPSVSFRTEHVSTSLPKTEAPEVYVNNFGGRSRIMSTPEPNLGVRSKTFFPVNSARTADEDVPKRKASHSEAPASRSNAQPPTPAPRPLRHPTPLSPTGSHSSEIRHKSLPKQSFRAQGITVQFSGKGATDEARRNALRKLGLLRDTS